MSYTLPPLPYNYNALEPHFDAQTMEIHHTKHHQAYITNLNKALEEAKLPSPHDVNDLIQNLSTIPDTIRTTVRNNAGGHSNHSLFWSILSPSPTASPSANFLDTINSTFGSLQQLKDLFNKAALSRFGSGWAWLILDSSKNLIVTSTPNQDSPLMHGFVEQTGHPLIGLDVWEHSYYLKFQNRRADYIQAFWNVLNWQSVDSLFNHAQNL